MPFFFPPCEQSLIRAPILIKINKKTKKKCEYIIMRKRREKNENRIQKWLKQEQKRPAFLDFYWSDYGLLV